ncbi:GGDEF domain-containing protein [Neobacillus dielmonensis]|uniref:GGDEF domain-containing protein n=1 Tax=Neobacillus dielmonensis TaxID=1347369 RepID=UPI000694351A|nr:GGDEF domain-containing protein [Neobacillus dielmonensis]
MAKSIRSFAELKRHIYLWVLPILIFSLFTNSILEKLFFARSLNGIINISLIIWFIVSWILLYKRGISTIIEYSNLILISIYHVTKVASVIYYRIVQSGGGELGDFIVWMPLYIMFIFFTLGQKRGLYFSFIIFLITLINGLMYIGELPPESVDSFIQFYIATSVYIIVLYYAQHLFKVFTEMEIVKKHAFLDSLTSIANRHQIDEWLEGMIRDARETGTQFAVIFFDIDHFKLVNDQLGHKTGDSVLIEFAQLVKSSLPLGDKFGRWGGEEFILISSSCGDNALKLAEYLRAIIENHAFREVKGLTASFGVADYQPGDTIDTLLNRADKGLYLSKKTGRNKVHTG